MANDKKNKTFLAALIGGLLGYGVTKAIEGSMENSEVRKLGKAIDEAFLEGLGEEKIIEALTNNAKKSMGDKFSEDVVDRIKSMVLEEKIKLRKEGKLKDPA